VPGERKVSMTYKEWEGELIGYLAALPEKDREEAANYYKEIYGDRREGGMTEDEILKSFGTPMLAAAKILADSRDGENEAEAAQNDVKIGNTYEKNDDTQEKVTDDTKPSKSGFSVSKLIGWICIILFVLIPLAAILISLIAAFGSVTVGSAAAVIGGVAIAIASPFGIIIGYTGIGALATAGAGLGAAGVGIILFIIFFYITKYTVISTAKITKYIFGKGRRA